MPLPPEVGAAAPSDDRAIGRDAAGKASEGPAGQIAEAEEFGGSSTQRSTRSACTVRVNPASIRSNAGQYYGIRVVPDRMGDNECCDKGRLVASSTSVVARGKWATKKADVAEHPEAFHHVGLLVNGSPAAADYPLFSRPITWIKS